MRISWIEPEDFSLSISRQLDLLSLSRQTYYYTPCGESAENLHYMKLIDKKYTDFPVYGVRRITAALHRDGVVINEKRVRRLMRKMGLFAIYPKPNLSRKSTENEVFPYLLRGLKIQRVHQVWSTDITYIPMQNGFLYLVGIIDWYSRFILDWEISNTLEASFCVDTLQRALQNYPRPEIFNTDQGSQFTAASFIKVLKEVGIKISMDGKGRALDNIFIERFWRSIKYEYVYIQAPVNGKELYEGVKNWVKHYNYDRPHQSLAYQTPYEKFQTIQQPPIGK